MHDYEHILTSAEQLSAPEKWRLVKQLLRSLETEQPPAPGSDWHTFLKETYGSLRDTPIERWPQGDYEEREPLE